MEFQIAQCLIIHKFTQELEALSVSRTSVTEQRGIRCGACPPRRRGYSAVEGRLRRQEGQKGKGYHRFAAGPLCAETSKHAAFYWVRHREFTHEGTWKAEKPSVLNGELSLRNCSITTGFSLCPKKMDKTNPVSVPSVAGYVCRS